MASGLSHLPLAGEDFHIWETTPDCLLVTTIRVLREELKLKLATALGVLLGYDLLFLHPREWGSEHCRWNLAALSPVRMSLFYSRGMIMSLPEI